MIRIDVPEGFSASLGGERPAPSTSFSNVGLFFGISIVNNCEKCVPRQQRNRHDRNMHHRSINHRRAKTNLALTNNAAEYVCQTP